MIRPSRGEPKAISVILERTVDLKWLCDGYGDDSIVRAELVLLRWEDV
jgi:hypothetical protein